MALRRPALPVPTRALLGLAAVLLLFPLAPWPRLQLALHAAIVVALCVDPRSYLATALVAAASGWTLEGSLKLMPRMGGAPFAAMTVALLAAFLMEHWPPESRGPWILRCLALLVALLLLTHGAVRLASGPFGPLGTGWSLAFLLCPLWGWVTWPLHRRS